MATEYKDARGKIIDVTDMEFHGLQIIESKKGSVRSNHYHKKGGHLLYVISGKMKYEERYLDSQAITETVYHAGESVFTGPMIAHKTTFLEDSVIVCCPTLKRTDNGYLNDLVRVEL
jgi:quercetin dioxygenase-like cupin family protein